uniref:Uncharacterized protein n=1 Tax=Cacopsylla melanoneura TaxID=428564 RepID=A0A8D8VTL5_9HEMI
MHVYYLSLSLSHTLSPPLSLPPLLFSHYLFSILLFIISFMSREIILFISSSHFSSPSSYLFLIISLICLLPYFSIPFPPLSFLFSLFPSLFLQKRTLKQSLIIYRSVHLTMKINFSLPPSPTLSPFSIFPKVTLFATKQKDLRHCNAAFLLFC